jgi:D-beta-D-heptose 7-phosphate kinase/D-beta-D-heptose 1-phosphate adenosyltransferase
LDAVDLVVVFNEDTPEQLISILRPDLITKGADYTLDQVVGRDIVESYGGQVLLIPLLKGYSTTDITNRVLLANSAVSTPT